MTQDRRRLAHRQRSFVGALLHGRVAPRRAFSNPKGVVSWAWAGVGKP